MKLVIGLGNPGLQYKWTRHNIGFEVIDKLAYEYKVSLSKNKFKGIYGQTIINSEKIIFLKPLTYMNLSGECVKDFLNFYKELKSKDLIVICDDINFSVGDLKIKPKGSSGGQNGIKNIIYHIETDEFIRIKIGVGKKPKDMDLSNFVLSKFNEDEKDFLINSIEDASEAVKTILDKENGLSIAMNKFNKKKER